MVVEVPEASEDKMIGPDDMAYQLFSPLGDDEIPYEEVRGIGDVMKCLKPALDRRDTKKCFYHEITVRALHVDELSLDNPENTTEKDVYCVATHELTDKQVAQLFFANSQDYVSPESVAQEV